jgi:hypothetical protein
VDPGIGPIREDLLAEAFLTAIGQASDTQRVMELHWRQAGLLQVERRSPVATVSGKILHLHQERGMTAEAKRHA